MPLKTHFSGLVHSIVWSVYFEIYLFFFFLWNRKELLFLFLFIIIIAMRCHYFIYNWSNKMKVYKILFVNMSQIIM